MKNVLFITYDFPFPTTSGGKNRAYHMLKYGGNHKKFLFSFVRDDFREEYKSEMEKIGVEVVGLAKRRRIRDIRNLTGVVIKGNSIFRVLYYSDQVFSQILSVISSKKIDVVHFESYYTAFFISERIKELGVRQVFGTENIEYTMYDNYAKGANRFLSPLMRRQVARIKNEEEGFYKRADICIAVSDPDAEYIRKFNDCEIVRNGVDIKTLKFKEPGGPGHKLLFVGNFSYFPNVDAIDYFYENVFKNLGDEFTLKVIGKKAETLALKNDKRVTCMDFIPDIADAYADADIMVSPIRLGGGTNFKIIEAMACGTPVVALPDRLAGLEVNANTNIIVVRDSQEYKEALQNLAADIKKRKSLAAAARKLVADKYSWQSIGGVLAKVWEKA